MSLDPVGRWRRPSRPLAFVAVGVLVLAGACSSGDDEGAVAPSPSESVIDQGGVDDAGAGASVADPVNTGSGSVISSAIAPGEGLTERFSLGTSGPQAGQQVEIDVPIGSITADNYYYWTRAEDRWLLTHVLGVSPPTVRRVDGPDQTAVSDVAIRGPESQTIVLPDDAQPGLARICLPSSEATECVEFEVNRN